MPPATTQAGDGGFNQMQQPEKVKTAPLGTAPVNNTVRRLRWLRKRDELERNPNAHFPITLYI